MSPERIPLGWTRAGKKEKGETQTTCRKTVETELSVMGLSWGEA